MLFKSFTTAFALAAAAFAGGFSADAQAAPGDRIRDTCDQVCYNRPNAQCYQQCFARDGGRFTVSTPTKPRRPQPVSVPSGDWRSAVYNTNSMGGTGGAGGGNGGGGGKK